MKALTKDQAKLLCDTWEVGKILRFEGVFLNGEHPDLVDAYLTLLAIAEIKPPKIK